MRSLPILAMTAHALESDKKKSIQAGMQEHLTKPIEPARMYETLAKWIRAGREEAARNAQSGAAPTDGITDMPGLSVHNALKNLAGNVTLYIKLLKRFVESYEHAAGQVSNALAAGDQELALHLAHTVKGVAANLGATSLAQIAGDLEKALAAKKEHDVLLAQMRDVLRQTVESIRCLIAATTKPAATVVQEEMSAERQVEVMALLRAAPELMSSDWISTQRQLQALESLLGHSATASAYAALMQAVDDFDADALREQTEKIIVLLHSA
jgi:HPt (histidine-containing phosphotransfer) domain-containing protein